MSEADLREQIRVLERVVAEQREALAPGTTPGRRARLLRNLDIVHRYTNEGWTQRELAIEFQLSGMTIAKLLQSYRIPTAMRQVDEVKRGARIASALLSGDTLQQIADRHGVSQATIRRILERLSIAPPNDTEPGPANNTARCETPADAPPYEKSPRGNRA